MVGRTPELLGKKIESREMKLSMLAVLILPLAILGFSAISAILPTALASISSAGPHGFRKSSTPLPRQPGTMARPSAALSANTPWYNTTLGISMLLGRFAYAVPVMAIAGLAGGKAESRSLGRHFRDEYAALRRPPCRIILIMGGLLFFPALALGPIVEHIQMLAGQTY